MRETGPLHLSMVFDLTTAENRLIGAARRHRSAERMVREIFSAARMRAVTRR